MNTAVHGLEDYLLVDQLSYSADKECSSNESSITARPSTQSNQAPISECQEAATIV